MGQDFKVTQGKLCIDVCADREEAERIAQQTAEDFPDRGEVSVAPIPRVELTPEEEAELTPYNCAAYNLARSTSAALETRLPCWLVMRDDVKKRLREEAAKTFNRLPSARGLSGLELEEWATSHVAPSQVLNWRKIELYHKQLRAGGNPRAWFC